MKIRLQICLLGFGEDFFSYGSTLQGLFSRLLQQYKVWFSLSVLKLWLLFFGHHWVQHW